MLSQLMILNPTPKRGAVYLLEAYDPDNKVWRSVTVHGKKNVERRADQLSLLGYTAIEYSRDIKPKKNPARPFEGRQQNPIKVSGYMEGWHGSAPRTGLAPDDPAMVAYMADYKRGVAARRKADRDYPSKPFEGRQQNPSGSPILTGYADGDKLTLRVVRLPVFEHSSTTERETIKTFTVSIRDDRYQLKTGKGATVRFYSITVSDYWGTVLTSSHRRPPMKYSVLEVVPKGTVATTRKMPDRKRRTPKAREIRRRAKNPCASKGYTKFHGNPPAKGWEVRVPDGFPKKLWLLGDHHRTVLADGSVLTGGLVCASTGNAIYLTGVKGNGMRGKKGRVNQIEYTPRKDSLKHGPTYYHPYKTPPTITKVQKGFYIIRGTRQKLTSRGIIG